MTHLSKLIIMASLSFTATIFSCSKLCDEGYEGKRCDVEMRKKFVGVWNAEDNPGSKIYLDTISEGTDILSVVLSKSFSSNFFQRTIKATVTSNSIVIPKQKPYSIDSFFVEGLGTINDEQNKITWTYNIIDARDSSEVSSAYTGIWTK